MMTFLDGVDTAPAPDHPSFALVPHRSSLFVSTHRDGTDAHHRARSEAAFSALLSSNGSPRRTSEEQQQALTH